ncbi:MAG TPA: hydantoinase/oxoprolinase family protein [Candidatus Binataceae bacterium]|nr:hydantoinase/oxoprolinase family protein [Candidatus Binataceae bacterium]
MSRAPRVAFDIGGTFTDIIVVTGDNQLRTFKVLSLTDKIVASLRQPIAEALQSSGHAALGSLVHGTTIGSNTMLEGKGANTGLITTRGFRDELEIRRMARPPVFDFLWERMPPLIPRRRRIEVTERITSRGEVFTPLKLDEVRDAISKLKAQNVEAVAICFINAFANPSHEQQAAALVRELLPDVALSISHEVLPEIREYERMSTTSINAYLMPVVNRYLNSLETQLGDYARGLRIMQSNGGVMTADHARRHPVQLIESGPAAGALAAASLTRQIGVERAVSFDMGGTTVKACLIEDHVPIEKNDMEVGGAANAVARYSRGAGYALSTPALDIVEAGAGGGSIAWIDDSGALRVGPVSASADPGPACYARGGKRPTITDANVVLGYMNPQAIAGGTVAIDRNAALDTINRELAAPLGLSVQETAYGIYQVANAAMTRAIRAVTTERGRDPRDYPLVGFGGSGPIHAADLAASLGMKRVFIPLYPGLFSAMGLMMADLRYDYVQSIPGRLDAIDVAILQRNYDALAARVLEEVAKENVDPATVKLERFLDLRYQRQSSEITIPVPHPLPVTSLASMMAELFHADHQRNYGYRRENESIAVVNLRLKAFAPTQSLGFKELAASFHVSAARENAKEEVRLAYFGSTLGEQPTRILSRAALTRGAIRGPLILEEFDTTVVVPPGWTASIDELGNIVLDAIPRT